MAQVETSKDTQEGEIFTKTWQKLGAIIRNMAGALGQWASSSSEGSRICPASDQAMDIDLLDKKIRRLVCKLNKHNIHLEVFEEEDILEYGRVLGRGGEGVVQRCTVRYNDIPIDAAVKTVLDSSDDAVGITLDEIELLCLGQDPIVNTTAKVYGVAAIPDKEDRSIGHLVIITEAGLMNALQLYQQEEVPLHVTYSLWGQLAGAVHCLHCKKIIHQDLKPENILITNIARDPTGQIEQLDIRIIDLGMGKRVFTERVVTDDILGTNGYHPPEVLLEDYYDFRADIFMLGVTFCVLLNVPKFLKGSGLSDLLKQLHAAKKCLQTGQDLYENVLEPAFMENHEVSNTMKDMICNMLEQQDKRTVTLVDVIETCRTESAKEKRDAKIPYNQPSPCHNGHDSGIGAHEPGSSRGVSSRNTSGKGSKVSSRKSSYMGLRSRSSSMSSLASTLSLDSTGNIVRNKRKRLLMELDDNIPRITRHNAKRLRSSKIY